MATASYSAPVCLGSWYRHGAPRLLAELQEPAAPPEMIYRGIRVALPVRRPPAEVVPVTMVFRGTPCTVLVAHCPPTGYREIVYRGQRTLVPCS